MESSDETATCPFLERTRRLEAQRAQRHVCERCLERCAAGSAFYPEPLSGFFSTQLKSFWSVAHHQRVWSSPNLNPPWFNLVWWSQSGNNQTLQDCVDVRIKKDFSISASSEYFHLLLPFFCSMPGSCVLKWDNYTSSSCICRKEPEIEAWRWHVGSSPVSPYNFHSTLLWQMLTEKRSCRGKHSRGCWKWKRILLWCLTRTHHIDLFEIFRQSCTVWLFPDWLSQPRHGSVMDDWMKWLHYCLVKVT